MDDVLTVYRAFDSHEMVGCKIQGVRHILNAAGDFNLLVADGGVRLAIFFFVGAVWAKDEAQKRVYHELKHVAINAALTSEELQQVVPN